MVAPAPLAAQTGFVVGEERTAAEAATFEAFHRQIAVLGTGQPRSTLGSAVATVRPFAAAREQTLTVDQTREVRIRREYASLELERHGLPRALGLRP